MTNELAAITAWRNQAIGANFEETILQLAEYTPGVMLIPQFPQVKFFRGGKAKIVGEAWPDYILLYFNRPFILDAKTTVETATFRPHKDQKHQFERLREAAGYRIGAFYLVYWLTHRVIEVHHVYENDLWPISFKYGAGQFRLSDQENWFSELATGYLARYYL